MAKNKSGFNKWSNIIATLATTTLAIVSLLTVYITLSAWRDERESARPYFTFKESPTIHITDNIAFNFQFNNVGNHPAINLWGKTIAFNHNLNEQPILEDHYSLVNDIPKDTFSELIINFEPERVNPNQETIDPHYIVISIHYDDPILKKSFEQTIYMKWNGKIHKKVMPIVHIEVEEKENITTYFRQKKINPHTKIESNLPLDHLNEP